MIFTKVTPRQYLTVCWRCRRGIYRGDATVRIPGHLGPAHKECS